MKSLFSGKLKTWTFKSSRKEAPPKDLASSNTSSGLGGTKKQIRRSFNLEHRSDNSQLRRSLTWMKDVRIVVFDIFSSHSSHSEASSITTASRNSVETHDEILRVVGDMTDNPNANLSKLLRHSQEPGPGCSVHKAFRNVLLERDFDLLLPAPVDPSEGDAFRRGGLDFTNGITIEDFVRDLPSNAQQIVEAANPIGLAERMLPVRLLSRGAGVIAACFWAWLCIIDDLTEGSDPLCCLDQCIEILTRGTPSSDIPKTSQFMHVLILFKNVVETNEISVVVDGEGTISYREDWREQFWAEVLLVVKALRSEESLERGMFSMRDWLKIRLFTISARPFMVLARASLGLPCNLNTDIHSSKDVGIGQIQTVIQAILGLQNDILGWEKDHVTKNPLNAIELLVREESKPAKAFEEVLQSHNSLVTVTFSLMDQYIASVDAMGDDVSMSLKTFWKVYVHTVVGSSNAMALWMLTSNRYKAKLRKNSEVLLEDV